MLKSNELRIGNLVQKDGMIIRVEGILEPMGIINDSENSMMWYCRDLEGIKLNDEWLLNFGFGKDDDWAKQLSAEYQYAGYGVTVMNGEWNFWITGEDAIGIKYVHQLQNIYFALSFEELILKTKEHETK